MWDKFSRKDCRIADCTVSHLSVKRPFLVVCVLDGRSAVSLNDYYLFTLISIEAYDLLILACVSLCLINISVH